MGNYPKRSFHVSPDVLLPLLLGNKTHPKRKIKSLDMYQMLRSELPESIEAKRGQQLCSPFSQVKINDRGYTKRAQKIRPHNIQRKTRQSLSLELSKLVIASSNGCW